VIQEIKENNVLFLQLQLLKLLQKKICENKISEHGNCRVIVVEGELKVTCLAMKVDHV
jgi:hypothetical protein